MCGIIGMAGPRLPERDDGTALTMSMEVYTDLDGNCFEAVGVPVDVSATLSSSIDESLGLLRRLHQAGAE